MALLPERKNILEMARGAIMERVDVEMDRVIENILDPNTPAKKKRSITLRIDLMPEENRGRVDMKVQCKSTLAPMVDVSTAMCITTGRKGELLLAELLPQVPGQIDVDGNEAPVPAFASIGR